MTYKRLKSALEQIAAGAPDPAAVAKEALRSRVVPAKPKPPKPDRSPADEIHDRMIARLIAVAEMKIANKSTAEIAAALGVSKWRASQLCTHAKRYLLHPSRRGQWLDIGGPWLTGEKESDA